MENKERGDFYKEVTNKIIAALENNTRPWVQPWNGGILPIPMRHNNRLYQGINTLILWQAASDGGYNSPYWMTFKQAKLLGGNIKKGEKAATIFYASFCTLGNNEEEDEQKGRSGQNLAENPIYKKFMKSYKVFNANQIDGLQEKYYKVLSTENNTKELEKLPRLEEFVKNTKANIKHGGIRAYYRESSDHIQMPEMKLFKNSNAYYSTLCHELTHWSGSKERLNCNLGGKRFGDSGYAMEELVAELGAAFLCSLLGINPDAREDLDSLEKAHSGQQDKTMKELRNVCSHLTKHKITLEQDLLVRLKNSDDIHTTVKELTKLAVDHHASFVNNHLNRLLNGERFKMDNKIFDCPMKYLRHEIKNPAHAYADIALYKKSIPRLQKIMDEFEFKKGGDRSMGGMSM